MAANPPILEYRFYDCTVSRKLLWTCFLILMGCGYLMAITNLYLTHQGLSGKPGISVEDIAASYYGNRSGTRLETAIRGFMSTNISDEDRAIMEAWLHAGAPETDYTTKIMPILKKTCLNCHVASSGMNLPDFSTYAGLHKVAEVDTGMSIATLVKLSHIHLFGISLLLITLGNIFIHSEMAALLKRIIIVTPTLSFFIDIAAWYLTKWSPIFAWVVVVAGAFMGISMGLQIFISLFQIWFLRRPAAK